MARIKKGILGGVSGTVGTVIGASWNGIEYVRSKPTSYKDANTSEQVEQRSRFKLISDFLSSLRDLVKFSFADYAHQMTGRNHALSYNLQNAVTGVYPNIIIDYTKVLVTRGTTLLNAGSPNAASSQPGKVDFSWTDNSGEGSAKDTDKAIMVVYCPQKKQSLYSISNIQRSAGAATLNVPGFSGMMVETWLAFISAKGSKMATSVYTGSVSVD